MLTSPFPTPLMVMGYFQLHEVWQYIDSEGMDYVANFNRGEVLKFTPEGKHLATIGSKGEQHQQFGRPCGICIDSDDIMYVTDETKHHVMVFATKGQYLGSLRRSGDKLDSQSLWSSSGQDSW